MDRIIPGYINDSLPLKVPRGCVGYWLMDDQGETIKDHSGFGRDLTNYGSTSIVGPTGRVRSFDGVDDYLRRNDSTLITTANWSFDAWLIHFDDARTTIAVAGTTTSLNHYRCLIELVLASHRISLFFNNEAGNGATAVYGPAAAAVPVNTWTHIAVTSTPNIIRMYKNGVPAHTSDQGAKDVTPGTTGTRFSIGGSTLRGHVGASRLYDRTLSPQEIEHIYRSEAWRYGLPG